MESEHTQNWEELETKKGTIAILNDPQVQIPDANSFLELLFSAAQDTIVLSKLNFPDSFYELKTGIAGEILQKLSNYKRRMIVLGDFSGIESKSLNDFLYECNKNGKIVFTDRLENAIDLLKEIH
ncbi:DUF4180 domain-containing protein [Leptospira kmetyi]|uniref:DUF4180 domain-containing protein n=1 Tax=Leptospira kmetyi TaxID=408139 RepID=A0AAD0XMK4_9LEPT|nr:DUF4180 domain-containing protein [Leptospira kmetyi]AYV54414.1 DUF4180 domain-containing protein [Leptospira kmetyi]PJZ30863.1 hypothetical protein CH378_05810 [Leptospira kmetyi]